MSHRGRCQRLSIPMLFLSSLTLFAGATIAQSAHAPAAPDVGIDLADGISSREAVVLALRLNLGLRGIRKAHDVAGGEVSAARALSEPELRMGWAGWDDSWRSPRSPAYEVAMRWAPPRPGERRLKGEWALGKVSEVDGEIAGAEQALAADILLLHTKIVFLDKQTAVAEAAVKLREQIVDFVGSQIASRSKTLLDHNVAELALADAMSLPTAYRTERLLCLGRLAGELNLPAGTDLKIQTEAGTFTLRPRPLDVAGLINQALTNRSELAAASARYAQARAMLNLKKAERYPWFSFFQVGRQFESGSSADSWGFRFGFELPIFKWNGRSLQAPTAEAERCQMNLEALKRKVSLEVEQLVTQLRARYSELERTRETLDAIVSRDLELSEQAMNLGRSDRTQVLLAQARQLQRQQAFLADLLDSRRLEIELDRATGSILRQ